MKFKKFKTVSKNEIKRQISTSLKKMDLEIVGEYIYPHDGRISLRVKDKNSITIDVWVDMCVDDYGDLNLDWNKFTFELDSPDDYITMRLHRHTSFLESVYDVIEKYMLNEKLISVNESGGFINHIGGV